MDGMSRLREHFQGYTTGAFVQENAVNRDEVSPISSASNSVRCPKLVKECLRFRAQFCLAIFVLPGF